MKIEVGKTYKANDSTLVEIYTEKNGFKRGKFLHGVVKLVRCYDDAGRALDIYGDAIGANHPDNIVEEYHEPQVQIPEAQAVADPVPAEAQPGPASV